MANNNKHVVKSGNGWAVKTAGYTVTIQRTQKAAITTATNMARCDRSEVVIHGRDGKIREKNSYGHDPRKTKG
ncbi:DUF2188 domain-containing protein [Bdellovibrio sp. 22V]|uniref:DUF2188 domain-containing protein n=1 Tax=Bdellovibrio sp. 22V TaxID=3044166 RepID=UPI002542A4C1|nr:DUF2188 domain-containing protein [Bdellovibrio sp. 22V]WII72171.1 DUF2188 domain-containing protein [Bdellovibrio sp. 22V]